jgi:hypothetical protein
VTDTSAPLPRPVLDALARAAREASRTRGSAGASLPDGHVPPRMRIQVVCYEEPDAWILGKIARRLCEALGALGMDATLGRTPDPVAEINHHVVYYDYGERAPTVETVMITHIDTERELGKVKRQLIDLGVEMGICMSLEAMLRLAHFGVPRERLCCIGPAHDGVIVPRKLLIGLTTRIYPDGCKREQLLEALGRRIAPDDFRFTIMGSGWEPVVASLRAAGIEVDYRSAFDPAAYHALMPTLDYYLYLGRDEGSMGFLDALAAGVPTIVTAQGFHLDVPDGITHAFEGLEDLVGIFREIAAARRRRVQAVAPMTWAANARQHLLLWDYLLRQKTGRAIPEALARGLRALAWGAGEDGVPGPGPS